MEGYHEPRGDSGFQVTGFARDFWGLKFSISGLFLGKTILALGGGRSLSRNFLGVFKTI